MNKDLAKKIRLAAMNLLARREHSQQELLRKLMLKSFSADDCLQIIAQLATEGLQADARFAEAYTNSRVSKGYGPQRINQELTQRGIAAELAKQTLQMRDDWQMLAAQVRAKRFGPVLPTEAKAKAQQIRFMQYRGFSHEHIRAVFNPEWV